MSRPTLKQKISVFVHETALEVAAIVLLLTSWFSGTGLVLQVIDIYFPSYEWIVGTARGLDPVYSLFLHGGLSVVSGVAAWMVLKKLGGNGIE